MRRIMIISVLFGLSLLGLAAPAGAASPVTADVTAATLVARGAAVDVTTIVTCPAGTSRYLSLLITQRSGNGVAQGGASASIACTGEAQAVTLRVTAQANGSAFRTGVAAVLGELFMCDEFQCEQVQFTDTVRITR